MKLKQTIPFVIILIIASCKQEVVTKKIGSCYVQENDEVKYLNKISTGDIDTINLEYVNAEFFEIIHDEMPNGQCVNNDIWAKDKLTVWYKHYKIEGANPVFFKIIDEAYATDKTNIFYKQELLTNVDVASFKTLGSFYAKDNNKIWYKGKEIVGVENVSDFKLIDSYFSSDKENVFLNNDTLLMQLPNSDAKTFMQIEGGNDLHLEALRFYKDKDKVYYIDTEKNIGEADFLTIFNAFTESYITLEEKYYSKDNFNIYYKNKIIENAERYSFNPIGNNYGKDSTKIYFKHKIMYGIDYKTFQIFKTDTTDAKDSLNYFLQGKKLRKI